MLESTFQHIQGIGEKTEKGLWKKGCTKWDHILENDFGLNPAKCRRVRAGILESKGRLEASDHRYFRDCLNKTLSWRAYETFRDHACFLDIETTGLSPFYGSHVTTVCLHSKKETKSYVAEQNLSDLGEDLSKYKYIVTFNGARFDLPFLTEDLGIGFDQIHLDLLYPLRKLGFSGGLKKIERQVGITRDTDDVTGFDAVRLWSAYVNGRVIEVAGFEVGGDDALDLLVKYNRDDTVNLEALTEFAVTELKKQYEGLLF